MIKDEPVVMVTQFMAAVPVGLLASAVTNIEQESDQITAAFDMLMQEF